MGVFNRDKRFGDLIRTIERNKSLDRDTKIYFIDYINGITNNTRNNDFYDDDLLVRVFLEVLNKDPYNQKLNFDYLIRSAKTFFPLGKLTENYNLLKELFVNCISCNMELFNDGLFAAFSNKRDYIDVVNFLRSDERLIKNANRIIQYGADVSNYCQTQDLLKREIISFASATLRTDNIDTLAETFLLDAKKRVGIYPVDEKAISLATSEFERARGIVREISELREVVKSYSDTVKALTEAGKKELTDARRDVINSLKNREMQLQEEINKRINSALADIETDLKLRSDKIFNQVIDEQSNKINEIKIVAGRLSSTTSDELLRIQTASEEAVKKLREYVDNEPKLQELLKSSENSNEFRELLAAYQLNNPTVVAATPVVATEEKPADIANTPHIYIPGYDRIVVPFNDSVKLPEGEIDTTILPAYDESIPFDKRIDVILKKMEKMKRNGAIFHEKTEQIIRCIMEGDWVYLWGPSGCGKSYLMKQVAKLLGTKLLQNGKITDKYGVMAYNDPHGRFRATPTFIALVYGYMIGYDEMDNGDSDTEVVLNAVFSGLLDTLENPEEKSYITFAEDMNVPINPNFRMISAGNTRGLGEDILNSARGKIDESVLERLTPIEIGYDNKVEGQILEKYQSWYDLFVKFRKACGDWADQRGMKYSQGILTTRDASALAKYVRHNSKTLENIFMEKFIQIKDDAYLEAIMQNLKAIYASAGHNIERDFKVPEKEYLREYTSEELGKKLVYTADQAIAAGKRKTGAN